MFVPKALLPKNARANISWALKNIPLAVLAETSTFGGLIMDALAKIEPTVQAAVFCETTVTAASAIELGRCSAIVPRQIVPPQFPKNFRQFDHPAFQQLNRTYVLAWTKRAGLIRRHSTIPAEKLLKALRAKLGHE